MAKKYWQRVAEYAKEQGYTHIGSVVKSHYQTVYYHILTVDEVIESGWQGAPINTHNWRGRVGETYYSFKRNNPDSYFVTRNELREAYEKSLKEENQND